MTALFGVDNYLIINNCSPTEIQKKETNKRQILCLLHFGQFALPRFHRWKSSSCHLSALRREMSKPPAMNHVTALRRWMSMSYRLQQDLTRLLSEFRRGQTKRGSVSEKCCKKAGRFPHFRGTRGIWNMVCPRCMRVKLSCFYSGKR